MIDEKTGRPKAYTPGGHRTRVEADRNRVVCTECSWFLHNAASSGQQLADAGWRHKKATTE